MSIKQIDSISFHHPNFVRNSLETQATDIQDCWGLLLRHFTSLHIQIMTVAPYGHFQLEDALWLQQSLELTASDDPRVDTEAVRTDSD